MYGLYGSILGTFFFSLVANRNGYSINYFPVTLMDFYIFKMSLK